MKKNIPVVGFLISDPKSLAISKTDEDIRKAEKLEKFKDLVKSKLCKFWSTKHELGAVVSRSMVQLIKSHPRPGWVRTDTILPKEKELELIELYQENNSLKIQLSKFETINEKDLEHLSQGDDKILIDFRLKEGNWNNQKYSSKNIELSWNQINKALFPKLAGTIKESMFKTYLNGVVLDFYLGGSHNYDTSSRPSVLINNDIANSIKIQLFALDLISRNIEKVETERGTKTEKLIVLTKKGEKVMFQLNAIRKK